MTLALARRRGHDAGVTVDGGDRSRVEYRQTDDVARVARLFVVLVDVFAVVWAIGAVAEGLWFLAPIAVAMACLGSGMCFRTAQLRIVADGDDLTIVNPLRTHRIHRDDIRTFRVEPVGLVRRRRGLTVKLRDHTSIECVVMNARSAWVSERDDLDGCQSHLNEWLQGRAGLGQGAS